MSKPPQKVKDVADGVSIAFGVEPGWSNFRKLIANPAGFIQNINNYDKDNISPELSERLDHHIKTKNIDPDGVKKVSFAAHSLANWQISLVKFGELLEVIKPLRDQHVEAKKVLTQTLVDLNNLHEEESDIKHAGLQTNFDGRKHIVHYEVADQDGAAQVFRSEVDPEIGQTNQDNKLESYLSPEADFGYGSGMQNESLYFISNEIKKKDQSKKLVLWEDNELRNQWDDKLASSYKTQAFEKTNSHQWKHEPSSTPVSLIDTQKTKGKSDPPQLPAETGDAFTYVPKKDRHLNNVFLQHTEQDKKTQKKAPWSHNTLNKNEKAKKYMIEGRPLFEGHGGHVQNISAGRDRIFYSSNVF